MIVGTILAISLLSYWAMIYPTITAKLESEKNIRVIFFKGLGLFQWIKLSCSLIS
jgi:hypothetical protein